MMPFPTFPKPQLFIRVTHTGVYADGRPNTSSVLLSDLDVGYEYQWRKVPVYVPFNGYIDIPASSRSMLSFDQGAIFKGVTAGIITAQFFIVPESYTTLGRPPAPSFPAGASIWNTTENAPNYSTGVFWVSLAGGVSLSYWAEAQSSVAPNATVYVNSWSVVSTAADTDAALVAKGVGATLAHVPDNTAVGGNKRGNYATDWQKSRTNATQVAAGPYSVIGGGIENEITPTSYAAVVAGGERNRIDGISSAIVGGFLNQVEADTSAIGGGQSNSIGVRSDSSFIGGGQGNSIGTDSLWSVIVGGSGNSIASVGTGASTIGGGVSNQIQTNSGFASIVGGSGNIIENDSSEAFIAGGNSNIVHGNSPNSTIGGGTTNEVTAVAGVIAGGSSNTVAADYGSVLGGRANDVSANAYYGSVAGQGANSTHYGEFAHSAGRAGFTTTPGGAQHSWVLWRGIVPPTNTATVLYLDGAAGLEPGGPFVFDVPVDTAYRFTLRIIAIDQAAANQSAWWDIIGGIYRNAGAATLIGVPVVTSANTGGGSAAWATSVTATGNNLQITATVPAGNNVLFLVSGQMVRLSL